MKKYNNPERSLWSSIIERPAKDVTELIASVQPILNAVLSDGDEALKTFSLQFDGVSLDHLQVSEQEIIEATEQVNSDLKASIQVAINNVSTFHLQQKEAKKVVETMPGVQCWRESKAIQKVGLYIPGGTAPLFSTVIMLGVPAMIAGCNEIILCTPPAKDGSIHPAILYTAHCIGIKKIYKVGGAQAIAAMAYGTETIPKVFKIFGPGNQYVTIAKQLVTMQQTAIDMPAGPSEVAVIADETSNPEYIAADLLAQAEHGKDSQVLLIANNESIIDRAIAALERQISALPRKELASAALAHSSAVFLKDTTELIAFVNAYAAEHLIISTDNALELGDLIHTAGSIFLGHYTPESGGDYASGTNHTFPTNLFANMYSGVSLDSFIKKITYQHITKEGLAVLGPHVERMAAAELLEGHKNAVTIRLQ